MTAGVGDHTVTDAALPPPGPPSSDGGPGRVRADVRTTVLPSGRRVVTDRVPGASSVSVLGLVGVGGRDEPAPLAGVSHFLEHLLCKGTDDRPSDRVAEEVDAVGGDLDAVTDRERTAVQVRVPAGERAFAIDLLGDLLLRPAIRSADVEVERSVILEELAHALDDPEDRAHMLAAAAMYGDHPLGREVIGDRTTLRGLDASAIAAFHRSEYRPDDMVVAVAGALDHDEVVEQVEAWDASAPPVGSSRVGPRRPPDARQPTTRVVRRRGEQVSIVLGWSLGEVAQDDRPALAVLAHILGGGPASRLFRRVRDDEGLAYAVDASLGVHSDVGAVTAFAGCRPAATGRVRDLIVAEVEALVARGPTAREVEVATGYIAGSSTLALEDTVTRAWWAAIGELERGGARPPEDWIDAHRRVTVDDVAAAASGLAVSPTVVAVGPVPRRLRL